MRFTKHIEAVCPALLIDLLAENCPVSKSRLKDCLLKGGIWIKKTGRKEKRIRRAKYALQQGDIVSIYYDEWILNQTPAPPRLLSMEKEYSVWVKPPQLLSQGSRFGDHCSLLRLVEKEQKRIPYLVHRLDREAGGIVLLAHSSESASRFSKIFRERKVEKRYRATVCGCLGEVGGSGFFETPLDGKTARTDYSIVHHESKPARTHVAILLGTGRFHQIRRHFSENGHPLVGDTEYGDLSAENQLHLAACELSFTCPFSGAKRRYTLPNDEMHFEWISG